MQKRGHKLSKRMPLIFSFKSLRPPRELRSENQIQCGTGRTEMNQRPCVGEPPLEFSDCLSVSRDFNPI